MLARDGEAQGRDRDRAVVLGVRLRRALTCIHDHLLPEALDEMVRAVSRLDLRTMASICTRPQQTPPTIGRAGYPRRRRERR